MDNKKELIRVTSEYFENSIDYHKLLKASKEYKNLLNKLCGQELDKVTGKDNIQVNNGMALGTLWAAMCIDDLIRTRKFIRGINKAIKEKINNKESIHILYAGTGPFATLLLPLILRYSKHKIRYTLLEINPITFKILQKVISELKLGAYSITLLNEDATKYKLTHGIPDIIISETMQSALAKEQQVSIFFNLMRQVNLDSIFIPKKIKIYLGLKTTESSSEKIQTQNYYKEKKVFEISKEDSICAHLIENQPHKEISFPKIKTIITKEKLEGFNQLALFTEIQVFKDEVIEINKSGLTTPLIIKDISNNSKDSITIKTQYKICNEPKLDYKIT